MARASAESAGPAPSAVANACASVPDPRFARLVMRNDVRVLVLLVGFLNAVMFQVANSVDALGAFGAIANTFGISAIVWTALFIAASLFAQEPNRPLTRSECWVYLGLAALFLLPLKYVGWVGLTLLALHVATSAARESPAARGAWILLAITFPMFWSKLIFSILSGPLLQVDAALVSLVLGLPRMGNVITLADGRSHLWIAAGCSSMANLSLVVLAWTMFRETGLGPNRPGAGSGLLCCGLIVAINVGRISLIGLYPASYALLHGAAGTTVVSWLIVVAVVAVFSLGSRRAP